MSLILRRCVLIFLLISTNHTSDCSYTQLMRLSGVVVVFSEVRPAVERLFRAHGVIRPEDTVRCHLRNSKISDSQYSREQLVVR